MNVISLFDGMSCGQIALERAGFKVDNYFASEIDKHAIKVTQKNYPKTIQIGDIQKVHFKNGVLYTENGNFNVGKIHLVIGGSPCQGFSFAGKQLNFDDPRSALFFEFVRILSETVPVKFLLENVVMKKEYRDVISAILGTEPMKINSSLVSAQNRVRLYWTDIPDVSQPEDKGIFLKDIILDEGAVRGKSQTVLSTIHKENAKSMHKRDKQGLLVYGFPVSFNRNTGIGKPIDKAYLLCSSVFRGLNRNQNQNCVVTSGLIHSEKAIEYMNRKIKDGRAHWDFKHHSDVRDPKSATIVANFFKGVPYNVLKDWDCIRKFHPIECERLQTVPDGYTEGVSDTQRYKMLGNGWTVDVITHILKSWKRT